jgi:hypothetical protein
MSFCFWGTMPEDHCTCMITRILIGIGISALGFLIVWKTQIMLDSVGPIEWAERNLGGGGSRLFYKLLGTVIILIGFMVITNLFNDIVGGTISGLFAQ